MGVQNCSPELSRLADCLELPLLELGTLNWELLIE
jgi:hypothetical protein